MLQKEILTALQALGFGVEKEVIVLEHPADMTHGDYSSNIAMVSAKEAGKNPRELAEDIMNALVQTEIEAVEKIDVADPGFINFFLSREFFVDTIGLIEKEGEGYGKNTTEVGTAVLVEHSSPNLFKPFHIGHVMNNTIGEAIVRLQEATGATVTKMSYPSDVSLGIGKAIWSLLAHGVEQLNTKTTTKEKLTFLGDQYVTGTRAFDESEETQSRVREITKMIYEQTPGPELDAYNSGKEINLDYFKHITERLGSTFDAYIFESEAGAVGQELVREHIGDVFTESEDAVVYAGEQDGLHTRVFINKEGYPTYEAKDIGLLKLKFDLYSPDRSIFITDNEQGPYFEVVQTAAGKINQEWQQKTTHITHGRMAFKGKKMSSRLGGIPLAEDLLEAIKTEALARSEEKSEHTAEMVAIAAIKYTILKNSPGKNINFDPETSLSFEGDSGPYLQYTAVRGKSLLAKGVAAGLTPSTEKPLPEITDVEKLLYRFPEVVARAGSEYAPQQLVTYLTELASSFNTLYGAHKIVDTEDAYSPYKLALTSAVTTVLANGLWMLGIPVPERM